MKQIIKSIAVAGVLLAASIASAAASTLLVTLGGVDQLSYNTSYSFDLSSSEPVTINGGGFDIGSFKISGPITVTTDPSPTTTTGGVFSFFGEATLGPGDYTIKITGTGSSGFNFYGGTVVDPAPIPGTLALLLGGLVLLCFWGWSGRTKNSSTGLAAQAAV
jgi:hypothetical protein